MAKKSKTREFIESIGVALIAAQVLGSSRVRPGWDSASAPVTRSGVCGLDPGRIAHVHWRQGARVVGSAEHLVGRTRLHDLARVSE